MAHESSEFMSADAQLQIGKENCTPSPDPRSRWQSVIVLLIILASLSVMLMP